MTRVDGPMSKEILKYLSIETQQTIWKIHNSYCTEYSIIYHNNNNLLIITYDIMSKINKKINRFETIAGLLLIETLGHLMKRQIGLSICN